MDLEAFEEARKTYDAVERCLERISEGATKLGVQASELMPDQPWQKIRSLGNHLCHDYDDISQDRLWYIVQTNLPSLSAACEDALRRLREGQSPGKLVALFPGAARAPAAFQNLAHLLGQRGRREGLLQKGHFLVKNARVDDGVVRVAGHVQYLHAGTPRVQFLGQFPPAHLRHHHVRDQQVNPPAITLR